MRADLEMRIQSRLQRGRDAFDQKGIVLDFQFEENFHIGPIRSAL